MIIFEGVTSSGTRYAIDDSCMAPRGSQLEREIITIQRKNAMEILRKENEHGKAGGGHPNGG